MGGNRVTEPAITVSNTVDFTALGAKWRDLEMRSEPSFFQSWTWTGCLAAERFSCPVLVEAREDGRTVALALFNRRGGTLYLGESGDAALDAIYIEFNGVLAESGREASLTIACLRAVRGTTPWSPRLVTSGINAATAVSVNEIGRAHTIRASPAPFADLTVADPPFLERRSTNTRQQLRRSDRAYAALGPIGIERADTPERAYGFLDALAGLHQMAWMARGQPGAFAKPFFGRFHHALIARGFPRDEIDLTRVTAGGQTIGFLYNFRFRGRSLAYQSGFAYADATARGKPGLTAHHQAIRAAIGWGAARYDFLAGDDRYKRSLSDDAETALLGRGGFTLVAVAPDAARARSSGGPEACRVRFTCASASGRMCQDGGFSRIWCGKSSQSA